MKNWLCAALPIAMFACADPPPTDEPLAVDLSSDGVARAIDRGDMIALLDKHGATVGRVTIEPGSIAVTLGDRDGSIIWDEVTARAGCDRGLTVIAGATSTGWTMADPSTVIAAPGCDRVLAVGERVASALEVTLPWRDLAEVQGLCTNVSTWVWGSSCSSCYTEACQQYTGGSCNLAVGEHTSGSCSSGSVYTSCSHTFCSGGEQQYQLEEIAQ
ncbi:MAG TPA: hypothetical protein VFQ53_31605 [Kofleriaceae bacterium]|nr:hypothetical protein [Kofleriaceae bacterium]